MVVKPPSDERSRDRHRHSIPNQERFVEGGVDWEASGVGRNVPRFGGMAELAASTPHTRGQCGHEGHTKTGTLTMEQASQDQSSAPYRVLRRRLQL